MFQKKYTNQFIIYKTLSGDSIDFIGLKLRGHYFYDDIVKDNYLILKNFDLQNLPANLKLSIKNTSQENNNNDLYKIK